MKKQIKIAYFPSNATKAMVLGSNGKSLDKYCTKCETEEDLSTGNYILDATFLVEDNLIDLLKEEVILKVLMDYGNEVFRISKVTVGTRYIDIVARQITIADSLTLWLEDVRPTNQTGSSAANYMVANATGTREIQVISDIQATSTAYYMRMSLYKGLHDTEQSFQNRWGGEVLRRGYVEYINTHIGIDRGFSIREGKNLTGFEGTSNIDNLVTRARGQGFNGILGNYIDSPLIGSYNRIYTDVIKYDDVKIKDENSEEGYDTLEQAQSELDRRIREEYSKNDIDKIKATYNINFVQLEKTEEYKDYVVAERVYLGDTIRVYIPKISTDIEVRATAKKYDVLAQKTKEIKLSNYIEAKPLSLKQIVDRLNSIDSKESILQQAKENASLMIKSGLKNSHVIVRENEIIIGDTKDINTMVKVWRWNNGGLGFSNTGYYGTYGTAITSDGKIVADFITTGVLNANLIKAGVLSSLNSRTWINMENGTFNLADKIKFDGKDFAIDAETVTFTVFDNISSTENTRVVEKCTSEDIEYNLRYQPSYENIAGDQIVSLEDAGAYVQLTFSGTAVDVYTSKTDDSCIAEIYIDNVKKTEVDLYSAPYVSRAKVYSISGLNPGTHIVKVVNTGRKNASSHGIYLNFESFEYVRNNEIITADTVGKVIEKLPESVNQAFNSINSTKIKMDKNGLKIFNGAFEIVDEFFETIFFMRKDGLSNVGMEIGRKSFTRESYIDFHSNESNFDYDARIICRNGTDSRGNGDLYLESKNLYHNNEYICRSPNIYRLTLVPSTSYIEVASANSGAWGITVWQSDIKLKKDIQYSNIEALKNIMAIKHREFNWKDKDKHVDIGYVAQELREINESYVFGVKQEDGSELLQPDITTLIPTISKAIQELKEEKDKEINELKQEIELLKEQFKTKAGG